MVIKNKRGWIKLVEAFLSILLIGVIMSIVVTQQNTSVYSTSSTISNYEVYILRSIELNESLREDITAVSASDLPLNWSDGGFPSALKDRIGNLTPSYLSCEAQICETEQICEFMGQTDKEIYAQKIFIASTYASYNPRQLKLFCWRK